MESEEWRPIPGYDGWYEVSNLGRIRSWRNNKWGRANEPKLMNPRQMSTGYPRVSLTKEGETKYSLVHHLVLEAFVGPRPAGCQGAHKDGNPVNSRLDNLRWATVLENNHDKFRHGTMARGSGHGMAVLNEESVRWIRSSYTGTRGEARRMAERLGVSSGTVSRVLRGEGWTHVH